MFIKTKIMRLFLRTLFFAGVGVPVSVMAQDSNSEDRINMSSKVGQLETTAGGEFSSRIDKGKSKNQNSTEIHYNVELSTKVTIPGVELKSCQATVSIEYHQRSTLARVKGSIENPSCAVGSGAYDILISVRNEDSVTEKLTFSETWQQDDSANVEFLYDYPIGEDMDLRRVRAKVSNCECTVPMEE